MTLAEKECLQRPLVISLLRELLDAEIIQNQPLENAFRKNELKSMEQLHGFAKCEYFEKD